MNREIKFRGTPVNGKHFVYGSLVKNGSGFIIIEHRQQPEIHLTDSLWRIDSPAFRVIPESVGQYTGLKDKGGKGIYEGDIINWGWNNGKTEIEQVKNSLDWDGVLSPSNAPFMSAWGSTCGRYFKTFMNIYDPTRYACVIGNIHEHKHLLL